MTDGAHPGRSPNKNPTAVERRNVPQQGFRSSQVGIQLLISISLMVEIRCSTLTITSVIAKSPTMMAMKSKPTVRVTDPKVSRSAPVRGS